MKKALIAELFEKFESACSHIAGVECWSSRELMQMFNYSEWRAFSKLLERAATSCKASGEKESDHFVVYYKMIDLPKGAKRKIEDVALTRYAAYLVAQNGDPTKPEIAFAQTYFAVQTRKQELIEARLLDVARVNAREKLSKSEKRLSEIIFERGVNPKSFAMIRSAGDKALFGGKTTQAMKKQLGVPTNRPLADFLPTLLIKAKDFAAELTSHNVVEKDLTGDKAIKEEHVDNNSEVREILLKRGVKPESLPPSEDVKKVQRRLEGDEKNLLNDKRNNEDSTLF